MEEEEPCSSDDERAGSGGGAKVRTRVRAGGGGAQAREHACPHCASTFRRKADCDRHVRTVHEKHWDYGCPHCPAAFGDAGNLRKHVAAGQTITCTRNEANLFMLYEYS